MNGFIRLISGVLTSVLMAMALVGGAVFLLNYQFDSAGPLESARAVTIRSGEGRLQIAEKLQDAGVVDSRQLFVINHFARNITRWFNGQSWRDLKAGEYEFAAGASMRTVLETISKGKIVRYRLTIPEGLTGQQIVKRITESPDLSGAIEAYPAEGSLLPDTYLFSKGSDRKTILNQMRKAQEKALEQLWAKRAPDLPLATKEEALILASIVEKETGHSSERARVASVFINRLRKGMRLQSDPTIIYGIVGGKGSLGRPIYRADIKKKTPYNTYHINGLPPTPICNPGRAAIEAVLQPETTEDLYFVADGTGGHKFSKTLKEHNAAVANWRVIEKKARERNAARVKVDKKKASKEQNVKTGTVKSAGAKPGQVSPKAALPTVSGASGEQAGGDVIAAASVRVSGPGAAVARAGGVKAAGAVPQGAQVQRLIPLPVRKPR